MNIKILWMTLFTVIGFSNMIFSETNGRDHSNLVGFYREKTNQDQGIWISEYKDKKNTRALYIVRAVKVVDNKPVLVQANSSVLYTVSYPSIQFYWNHVPQGERNKKEGKNSSLNSSIGLYSLTHTGSSLKGKMSYPLENQKKEQTIEYIKDIKNISFNTDVSQLIFIDIAHTVSNEYSPLYDPTQKDYREFIDFDNLEGVYVPQNFRDTAMTGYGWKFKKIQNGTYVVYFVRIDNINKTYICHKNNYIGLYDQKNYPFFSVCFSSDFLNVSNDFDVLSIYFVGFYSNTRVDIAPILFYVDESTDNNMGSYKNRQFEKISDSVYTEVIDKKFE